MIRPTEVSRNLANVVRAIGGHSPDVTVSGIVSDNRQVLPGDVFAAVPGEHVHGARFAADAVARGARAIVTDEAGAALIDVDVPVVLVDDVPGVLGPLAAELYAEPAKKLTTYGVTGTNGKTTTAFMIEHILSSLGRTTGLVGTVAARVAGREIASTLTTPQPADLQTIMAALVETGGEDFVMEVSSHALIQGRTSPVKFSVAGFTNLTQDHLDFHETMEEYFAAKAKLFDKEKSSRQVITTDSDAGRELFARLDPHNAVALGVFADVPPAARYWRVTDIERSAQATRFAMTNEDGYRLTTFTTLPGDFNIANAALAIAMIAANGIDLAQLQSVLDAGVTAVVPGRMETLAHHPRVIVDFAHNEDALDKALSSLADTTRGKLIVVTGAAGDRDRGKRPGMARVIASYADFLVVTDDDPHSEDPQLIRNAIIAGIPAEFPYVEIADREAAIRAAIARADDDDTVFIAGRGHETIQDVDGVAVEIDDRRVAREALEEKA